MKRRLAIGLFLSALFIYLSFWKPNLGALVQGEEGIFSALFGHSRIDLDELGEALAKAHYGYLLIGVFLLLGSLFFRAERWRILLRPVFPGIRYWSVYSAMNAGYMINNVLPLRMGELFRAYFLGRREGISKSSALATIVVERIIDLTAMVVILAVAIFLFPFPQEIRNALFILGAGIILGIAFLASLLVNQAATLRILVRLLKPFPQRFSRGIINTIGSFSSGLEILRSSHHYLAILGYTVVLQASYVLSVFVTLLAFDLVTPQFPKISEQPVIASVVLLIFNTIGVAVPSAPGAVGTYHYIVASGLLLFDVAMETALGVAITLHLAQYIPLTLLGLACFWSQNFRFSDVKSQLPRESEAP